MLSGRCRPCGPHIDPSPQSSPKVHDQTVGTDGSTDRWDGIHEKDINMTDQTKGRERNGAIAPGQPDAKTSDEAVKRNGRREQRTAGPDGPDATEVGDTFKTGPGGSA